MSAAGLSRFRRDGLVFDVSDSGTGGPEVAVLLHGFPQDRTAFDAVVPVLGAAGVRTLAPDQRGYSPGARPSGRSAYRISECALDVVALLDAAGVERAHVVGHDWGGAVAWALAGNHRDRVATVTVLSTPHPRAMGRALTRSTQPLMSWYMAFFQLPVLPELAAGRTLGRSLRGSGLPEEHVERYVRRMREPGALSAALGWYRAIPFAGREPVRRSGVPTTYVWGRKDFALGRVAAEGTADAVTGPYRFVELDAGHWLPETHPAEVSRLVLERIQGTPPAA